MASNRSRGGRGMNQAGSESGPREETPRRGDFYPRSTLNLVANLCLTHVI